MDETWIYMVLYTGSKKAKSSHTAFSAVDNAKYKMTSLARAKLLELGSQHSLMLHHLLATVHRPAVQHRLQRLENKSTNGPTGRGREKIKQKAFKKTLAKPSGNKKDQETCMQFYALIFSKTLSAQHFFAKPCAITMTSTRNYPTEEPTPSF